VCCSTDHAAAVVDAVVVVVFIADVVVVAVVVFVATVVVLDSSQGSHGSLLQFVSWQGLNSPELFAPNPVNLSPQDISILQTV